MLHIRFEYPGARGTKSVDALCHEMEFGDRLAVGDDIPDCPTCLEIREEEDRLDRKAMAEYVEY